MYLSIQLPRQIFFIFWVYIQISIWHHFLLIKNFLCIFYYVALLVINFFSFLYLKKFLFHFFFGCMFSLGIEPYVDRFSFNTYRSLSTFLILVLFQTQSLQSFLNLCLCMFCIILLFLLLRFLFIPGSEQFDYIFSHVIFIIFLVLGVC